MSHKEVLDVLDIIIYIHTYVCVCVCARKEEVEGLIFLCSHTLSEKWSRQQRMFEPYC